MNQILINEEGVTLHRTNVAPCSMTWGEVRSVEAYKQDGMVCLDFNSSLGGYFTVTSEMEGYELLLDAMGERLSMTNPEWRVQMGALSSGQHGGMVEIFERDTHEEAAPVAAGVATARVSGDRSVGPGRADVLLRQAMEACWQSLPGEKRDVATFEQEMRRLVLRAMEDWREDFGRFGF